MTPTPYDGKPSTIMALNLLTLNGNAICNSIAEERHIVSSALWEKASIHHPEIGLRVMIPSVL